jgi:hypothetical protein
MLVVIIKARFSNSDDARRGDEMKNGVHPVHCVMGMQTNAGPHIIVRAGAFNSDS